MKFLTVLCLAFVGLLTFPAKAATLTSTFTYTASGTIGSQAFTNARITLTAVGDTGNRVTYGGTAPNFMYYIVNDSVTISISGVGTFQFTSPALTSVAIYGDEFSNNLQPGLPNVGNEYICLIAGSSGWCSLDSLLFTFSASVIGPWNMSSSFGPLTPTYYLLTGWNVLSMGTSGGMLNIYDIPATYNGSLIVQATVTTTIAVAPTPLNLSYQIGGVAPVGVLQISGMGSAQAFTVSSSNWLSVNPPSGTTPTVGTSPVTVNVNTNGLVAGTASGTVSVMENGATIIVPVYVTVTSAPIPNPYDLNGDGVVNVVDIQIVINAALGAIGGSGQEN